MAETDQFSQDEFEELLLQAQTAAGHDPAAEGNRRGALPQRNAPRNRNAASAIAAEAALASVAPASGGTSKTADSRGRDFQSLFSQAEKALASLDEPAETPPGMNPFPLRDLDEAPFGDESASLELLRDVDLDLRIELGRTQMYLEDVLKLRRGSVVTLDKLAGDPVDIYAGGRLIARGDVLVMNDNFCIRVSELVAEAGK